MVSADWVSYKTRLLQLERQSHHHAPPAGVTMRENERGDLAIAYRGHKLRFCEIAHRPLTQLPPRRNVAQLAWATFLPLIILGEKRIKRFRLLRCLQLTNKGHLYFAEGCGISILV